MDNYVGKRIDSRYEIQEVIGVGGMAVVYKAYDTIDDRIVAVKILKEEYLANEEFRRKFKNESKAIAILNHPNIVKVYDVSFGERIQYIVMEYIDGITLKEYINTQGSVQWKEAVHFETQILQALQHAHDKGIIHRDIKPQNIMLLQNGTIKVTDFGIARFARSETKTMTNSAIGSVHYISPEQARADYTDERADLYSAGVVLYEMITGKVPFNADSAVSIAIMQLQKEAELPSKINSVIPKGLEQITMHAMQKNPRERYQSAAEMLMDLAEISENPMAVFAYTYNSGEAYIPSQDKSNLDDEDRLVEFLEKEEDAEADELTNKHSDDYYRDKYYSDKQAKNKDDKASKKKVAIISAVTIAVVAIIALICVFVFGGEKITVPNFVGMNYNEEIEPNVTDDVYKNGKIQCKIRLEYTDDSEKYSDFETGDVVFQTPDAGIKIKTNKTVTLTILSTGKAIKIPDVVGMTKEAAQIELKAKGFKNVVFEEKPSKQTQGNVISTSPEVGSEVDKDTKITVYVSAGKTFKMPSVVGMSKADAQKFLKDYELDITFESVDSTSKKDQVIEQSVSEGTKIDMGSSVTLKISSGTAPTTTTTTTTEKAETNVVINFKLPTVNGAGVEGGDASLKFYVGNSLVSSDTVRCSGGSYNCVATGKSGTKDFSIVIDGEEKVSGIVNFDNGTYS